MYPKIVSSSSRSTSRPTGLYACRARSTFSHIIWMQYLKPTCLKSDISQTNTGNDRCIQNWKCINSLKMYHWLMIEWQIQNYYTWVQSEGPAHESQCDIREFCSTQLFACQPRRAVVSCSWWSYWQDYHSHSHFFIYSSMAEISSSDVWWFQFRNPTLQTQRSEGQIVMAYDD